MHDDNRSTWVSVSLPHIYCDGIISLDRIYIRRTFCCLGCDDRVEMLEICGRGSQDPSCDGLLHDNFSCAESVIMNTTPHETSLIAHSSEIAAGDPIDGQTQFR
jgi:hypothetical protein